LSKSAYVLIFALVLLVSLMLARPLVAIDETRYLAVAWEMWLSGDPFHLTRNFEPYADKPPLLFWLINLVWLVTGVSETAARLVGPVCAVAAIAATGWLARTLWPDREKISLRSMIAVASFPVFLIYGSATMFDALLAVMVILAHGVLWRIGQVGSGRRHWVLLGLAVGMGVLAKGPVMLLHVIPAILTIRLWSVASPDGAEMRRGLALAVLVALGPVLVWLGPTVVGGSSDFLHDLLWKQTAARVTGEIGHGRPIWFLLALLPIIVFPWGWSMRLWAALPAVVSADRPLRFALIWAVGATLLFSIVGGKQMHYLLPELPALALIAARVLDATWARPRGSLAPLGLILLAVPFVLIVTGGLDGAVGEGVVVSALEALLLGACCLALAVVGYLLPSGLGHALMGIGVTVALHLAIAFGGIGTRFDTSPIAAGIAARIDDGIAVVGMPYNADFNFKARLTAPLATPDSDAALADWTAAHPTGWIVGFVGHTGRPDAPAQTWSYRGRTFGIWPAVKAPPDP
jgi:4-amino-4-deoxy-L-arabinose transferase-like glycosyltransferase